MARILVADDETAIRRAIRRLLEKAGYEVEEAADGAEAQRLQRERPCDLLIIDLYMPGTDGLETIIRLKAEEPALKIVALSGGGFRDKEDVLTLATRVGADGALAKPFERTDLMTAISVALGAALAPGRQERTEQPPKDVPHRPRKSRAKASVLIVDDNEQARSVLGRRLESSGFAVVGASNAGAALEASRASPVQIAVVDLILPDADGADLIAALRAERPSIGIIAISGAPHLLAAVSEEFAGVAGFRTLAKPFSTPELLDAIEAVLPRKQGRRSLGERIRALLRFLRRGGRSEERRPADQDRRLIPGRPERRLSWPPRQPHRKS